MSFVQCLSMNWQEEQVIAQRLNNRTLVVGLGETGVATVCHLRSQGRAVLVIDSRVNPPGLERLRQRCPEVPVVLETLSPRWLLGIDEVVLSPGLAADIQLVAEAHRRGISVVSDIELFAREIASLNAAVLAVTGSNGKSTVVTMLEAMLQASEMNVTAGGNLGPPALSLLGKKNISTYLLEISSFQLETTKSLRPLAAAVLNVSADHLDRHKTLERYVALKEQLLTNSDIAIVNWDDPIVRRMGMAHPKSVPYSVCEPLEQGYSVRLSQGERWFARNQKPLVPVSSLMVGGTHNESNALAALALAEIVSTNYEPLLEALQSFHGLPHRCQWVGEKDGVAFINDSKATNVGATLAALNGISGSVILIAGGRAKGADFTPMVELAREKLKGAILIGESAEALRSVLADVCPTELAGGIDDAVSCALFMASAGDTILFSPACASQDMFLNYQVRGDAFVKEIQVLLS